MSRSRVLCARCLHHPQDPGQATHGSSPPYLPSSHLLQTFLLALKQLLEVGPHLGLLGVVVDGLPDAPLLVLQELGSLLGLSYGLK